LLALSSYNLAMSATPLATELGKLSLVGVELIGENKPIVVITPSVNQQAPPMPYFPVELHLQVISHLKNYMDVSRLRLVN
jgi:hypothetical protein